MSKELENKYKRILNYKGKMLPYDILRIDIEEDYLFWSINFDGDTNREETLLFVKDIKQVLNIIPLDIFTEEQFWRTNCLSYREQEYLINYYANFSIAQQINLLDEYIIKTQNDFFNTFRIRPRGPKELPNLPGFYKTKEDIPPILTYQYYRKRLGLLPFDDYIPDILKTKHQTT